MSDTAGARRLAQGFTGLDTSGVEVDEEQIAPTITADSPEEAELLTKMGELVKAAGNQEAIEAPSDIKLMCLRGRKYDIERAADLLPRHLDLRSKICDLGRADNEQLKADLQAHKLVYTGGKDADGRAIIWVRLRYHDPKKSKAVDMARLLTTVLLEALKDVDVQRFGVVVVNDMNGLRLKNLDPSIAKMIMGTVFPAMPIRVARICIFNPPWFIGHIVLPIVFTFMSKKLRGRIALLNGADTTKLQEYLPSTALPAELGGTLPWDADAWSARMTDALP